jgi:hypothetical protein
MDGVFLHLSDKMHISSIIRPTPGGKIRLPLYLVVYHRGLFNV